MSNSKYITGIGGFFFRSKDPKATKDWYINTLGINIEEYVWNQEAGPTVFEPFKNDSDYFPSGNQWMLNLRVNDLNGLITELETK